MDDKLVSEGLACAPTLGERGRQSRATRLLVLSGIFHHAW